MTSGRSFLKQNLYISCHLRHCLELGIVDSALPSPQTFVPLNARKSAQTLLRAGLPWAAHAQRGRVGQPRGATARRANSEPLPPFCRPHQSWPGRGTTSPVSPRGDTSCPSLSGLLPLSPRPGAEGSGCRWRPVGQVGFPGETSVEAKEAAAATPVSSTSEEKGAGSARVRLRPLLRLGSRSWFRRGVAARGEGNGSGRGGCGRRTGRAGAAASPCALLPLRPPTTAGGTFPPAELPPRLALRPGRLGGALLSGCFPALCARAGAASSGSPRSVPAWDRSLGIRLR